jgi:SOS-response transcriptional repressor LexA
MREKVMMLLTEIDSYQQRRNEYSTLSSRIKKRFDELNQKNGARYLTQTKIAKIMNVSQGAVGHWISGRRTPSIEELLKLAEILQTNVDYLTNGISLISKDEHNQINVDHYNSDNVSSRPISIPYFETFENYSVPVLEWTQAREGINAVAMYAKDCKNVILFPKKINRHTFALEVKGNSMSSTSMGVKGYYPGQKVIIDPVAKPSHEKCVLAYAPHLAAPILRQYNDENGVVTLKALDFREKTIDLTSDWAILGVVIGGAWEE